MPSSKSHITIHDLAKELGISASTVSRALKNNPRISESTKEAVRNLAVRYDYRPNTVASSLRRGDSNTVGVIVPNIHRSFFSNIIGGIEEELSKAGYNLMICQSNEKIEKEKSALSTLLDARVSAIFMSLSMESDSYDHIQELLDKKIKMFFFDRIPNQLPVRSVAIDDFTAAFQVTEHLIQQGSVRPAHIGGSSKINVYAERQRGFMEALTKYRIKLDHDYIISEDMTVDGGKRAFEKFMKLQVVPDSIMCSGDFTALGVVLSARELHINIPSELAVSGFANEDFTPYISPPITSVDQKGNEIGRQVASAFLSSSGANEIRHSIIEPKILYRESTLKVK